MGVKEYWLIEDALMPTYTHLIDLYSHKQREEWSVKVEDFEGTSEVKEECEDGSNVTQPEDEIISTKELVGIRLIHFIHSCLILFIVEGFKEIPCPVATHILLRHVYKWAKKVDDPRFFFNFISGYCKGSAEEVRKNL